MNRKSFLNSLGIITGGAFISLQSKAFTELHREETISGTVTDQGKGVKNVVISDGYTVVLTDASGRYTISPNAKSKTLFMSTPSGYEFKTDYNLARQYETLGSRNQYDFKLTRLKKNDNKHNFIIWADPQTKTKKDVQQMMDTSVPDTIETIHSLGKDALVHGICVGDIVWDNHALFPDYNKAVAQMGIPFFQALGNHDMDYRLGGDDTSDATFKEIYGPTYYSFNRGKAHYVVMDDVRYLGTERAYDGYITEDQLAWLAKDLQHADKNHLLIINLHIPVYSHVKNNQALYDVLAGFKNVHIMSGHTHYNANKIDKGIFEHNHGTVCGAWWTGPICEDGTPRGYAVYEVNGTELKWYYKSTGLPKDHQISLFTEKTGNTVRVSANVWNWDTAWSVEYFLDAKPMGQLKNQTGFDPLSVTLYKGDLLPEGRHFPEPHMTDHLFIAEFEAGPRKIKVVAKDRFGVHFSAEAEL